jgi:6-phosphogluconolactonase
MCWAAVFAFAGGPAAGLLAAEPAACEMPRVIAYIGTYTGPKSQGIYAFRVDPQTGAASPLGCVAQTVHPSFLALHPSGKFLYAVSEVSRFADSRGGAVAAFTVDAATGALMLLNQQSSGGAGPCHLSLDKTGRHVLVANYSGGSVAVLPVRADGSLGEASAVIRHSGSSAHPQRQRQPHAHSVNLSPDNRHALVADLGTDRVMVYRFDADRGSLEPAALPSATLPPGSGPRHLAFHPDGRRVFVINELLSTLTLLDYDPDLGRLTPVQTLSTLPENFSDENTTAEVVVHPRGRFVYGSNRGHDSIVVFAFDPAAGGRLKLVEHVATQGRTPRNFALDPTGQHLWAANQGSDTVVIFRVDTASGRLQPTGQVLSVGAPVCVRFLNLSPPAR